jgi:hypothetical protein
VTERWGAARPLGRPPRTSRHPRHPLRAAAAAAVALLLVAACSSSGQTSVGTTKPAGGTSITQPPSGPTTTLPGATTTTPPLLDPSVSIVAFLPEDASPYVAGQGALTVTGGAQATAQFSAASCDHLALSAATGWVARLTFVAAPGTAGATTYVVDFAGGEYRGATGTVTYQLPDVEDPSLPRQVRFSAPNALRWGTIRSGAATGGAKGELGLSNFSKAGSFDLQLTADGNDRAPVHVVGNWQCAHVPY